MSESSSLARDFTESRATPTSDGGTSLPLMMTSAYQDELMRHRVHTLPNLPSHRYRYTVWHELNEAQVTGDQLRAPRVRDGPEEKELLFYRLHDENKGRIHHTRRGRERRDHRDKTENWESAVTCNLSYQELHHAYQMDNFMRVLKRLKVVEDLTLMSDTLVDLSSVTFQRLTILNLTTNYIPSFKKLPKLPAIKHLIVAENYIKDLKGIEALKRTPIETLDLQGNPVAFTLDYRQRVFAALPRLKLLDNVAHMPEDDEVHKAPEGVTSEEDDRPGTCVLS